MNNFSNKQEDLTSSVDTLIDRIKEENTRQKFAIENNKGVVESILTLMEQLEDLDFNDEINREYQSDFENIKSGVLDLIKEDINESYKERVVKKEKLNESIFILISKLKSKWEMYLDEYSK